MTERTLIYDENLMLNISGETEYHRRFGLLRKKEIIKRYAPTVAVSVIFSAIFAFMDRSLFSLFIIAIICATAVFVCSQIRRNVNRTINTVVTEKYKSDVSPESSKKITLKENGMEVLSPYSRCFIPYSDIECVLTNNVYFYIRVKESDICFTVPKLRQDLGAVVNFDHVLRVKLEERYMKIEVRGGKNG